MTKQKDAAAAKLMTAVCAMAWFLENSNENDPNRTERFFEARNVWRDAMADAEVAGIYPDIESPWLLITAADKPQRVSLELTPAQVHRLAEHLRHEAGRYNARPEEDVDWDGTLESVLEKANALAPEEVG